MVTLLSVHIDAFGNLSDYNRTFDKGLNTILGDNSTGKTTLLAFIRCMFYGLYEKKYLDIDKQREMYRPWHMDKRATFGGSMNFLWDGNGKLEQYSITRKFGSTAKSDSCQLVNLDHNQICSLTNNIGEQIFGFNLDTFERSIFVHQEQTTITGDSGELASRLSRMVDGQGDHQLALDKLDKSRKTFVLNGNKGYNNVLQSSIVKQQDQLDIATNKLVIADNKSAQLTKAQSDKQQLQANCDKLRTKQQQLSIKLATSPAEQANANKVAEAKQILSHAEWCNIDSDYNTLVQLSSAKPTKTKGKLPAKAIFAILGITAIIATILSLAVAVWAGVVVAVLAVLVLVLYRPTVTVDNSSDIASILTKYLPPAQCTNSTQAIAEIFAIRDRVHTAKATITALGDVSVVDNSANKEQWQTISASIAQCERQIDILSTTIGSLTADINSIYQQSNVAELQDQLDADREQWQLCNYRYNIVTTLQDVINNTKQQMSLSYLPELSTNTTKLLSDISSGRWQQVSISDKFMLTMSEQGVLRDIKYFSCGTRELVLFCYRVALSIKLYGDKLPLLLVDDAFVNLDDSKFSLAMKVLDNLATRANTQIVYVSCHNARHGK